MFRRIVNLFGALLLAASCCNCSDESLSGKWLIHTVTGIEDVSAAENQPYITFTDATSYSGNAGANQFFGTYKAANGKITLSANSGMTKMMADPVTMQIESCIMDIVNDLSRYSFAEDACLILSNADGSKSIILSKAE